MNVLAVDTSTTELGIGVVTGSGGEYARRWSEIGHSEPLFPRIDHAISQVGIESAEIDLLAVISGPGSFTGLRIGMAGLLGWGVTAGIPVQPVDTFAAMTTTLKDAEFPRLVAIHSRGEEYYLQYHESPGHVTKPYVGRVDSAMSAVADHCLVCGSGAERFVLSADALASDRFRLAPPEMRVPDMIAVCREAERMRGSETATNYDIEPFYMTLSQAEIRFESNENRDNGDDS